MSPRGEKLGLLAWMASRLWILTKEGERVLFRPNPTQLRLYGYMAWQEALGYPVRIRVLKARQAGISTAVQARLYSVCHHVAHVKAFVCAHEEEPSAELFRMSRIFHQDLPEAERRPTDYSSKKEIIWSAPHRSLLQVQTAGKLTLKRSATIHHLHCSEVGFYRHALQTLTSVLQCVPSIAGTSIVQESTACGASGVWYDGWNRDVRAFLQHPDDPQGYLPVFISWLSVGGYALPLEPGEQVRARGEREEALVRRGATPEQLKWRRWKIATDLSGDEDMFWQEFPSTPREAFLATGRPAIPYQIVEHHESLARPPAFQMVLAWEGPQIVRARKRRPGDRFWWDVWRLPRAGCDYTVGGDPAEGLLADPADPKSDPDYDAGAVLNRRYLTVDATCHGRLPADAFGEELLKAAVFYNAAWASPEINGPGLAALAPMKRRNYPYIYERQKGPESLEEDGSLRRWGWRTTGGATGTRDYLIDTWIACCRPSPDTGWEDRVVVWDPALVAEERAFVHTPSGKRQHEVGHHDDRLFAAMIALMLHLECPRGRAAAAAVRALGLREADRRRAQPQGYPGETDAGLEAHDEAGETTA